MTRGVDLSVSAVVWFSSFVLAALLLAGAAAPARGAPAQTGWIDLSEWDPQRSIVKLSGLWEFYWGELLEPADFDPAGSELANIEHRELDPIDLEAGENEPVHLEPVLLHPPDREPGSGTLVRVPAYIPVPDYWNGHRTGPRDARGLPGQGYGTYRLRVRLPENAGRLAMYIPYEQTAYRLWVNGEAVAANGVVGRDRPTSTPQYLPTIVHIAPGGGLLELVVQVSNFSHRAGGLVNSPILGAEARVERMLALRLVMTAFFAGVFVFVAIYHAALHIMRRGAPAALYLALFSTCIALRTLVMGDHISAWLLPWLGWEPGVRIEYAAGFMAFTSFALFLKATFPAEMARAAMRAIGVYGIGGAAVSQIVPVRFTSLIIPGSFFISGLTIAYFILVGLLAYVRRRPGSRFILGGGVVLAVTVVVDFLYYSRVIEWVNLTPFGFAAFIIAQAFVLGNEFAEAFRRQSSLLAELQSSRGMIARLHERERRDVAEFLHSRVQSRLFLIAARIRKALAAMPEDDRRSEAWHLAIEAATELDRVREEDIRRASHLLHPAVVDVGLVPALQALAAQYREEFAVSVVSDPELAALDREAALDPEKANLLPPSIRLCAYRIVEECLVNLHAHASARRVEIEVGLGSHTHRSRELSIDLSSHRSGDRFKVQSNKPPRELRITVRDDGTGFDPAKAPKGLGIKIVEARVAQEGGSWRVTSAPGAGTTVEVRLPLGDERAASHSQGA